MTTRYDPVRIGAEVLLCGVTLAAVAGLGRLFDDGSYLAPLAVQAVLAHLVVTLLRRRGLSLLPSAGLTAIAAAVAVGAVHYPATTFALLPTSQTWRAATHDLGDSWNLFRDVVAPAPAETGFLVATAITVWFVAFVADWAAFRLWVPFESTLPAGTLFVFASYLGADENRVSSAALFAAAVIGFLLVHRVARQDRSAHWVGDADGRGRRSMLLTGSALAAVAVLFACTGGPLLPGAKADAVIDFTPPGPDRRVTVSPLVDIRSRLVDQADVEVFTVQAAKRAYWRLTSLDEFDGRIWSSSGSYGKAEGRLDRSHPGDAPASSVEQIVHIQALSTIWLPAAYEPTTINPSGQQVRYDEVSGTLIVDQTQPTSDGLVYSVVSELPVLTKALLAPIRSRVPSDIRDRYMGLPSEFPPAVQVLASQIASGADPTPYARARALQDFFRSGDFTYDLRTQPGHSDDALSAFLFDTKRGYCEQFAGAYAAMARSIGLPTRVAVGFTPGVLDDVDPTLFHVRGQNAHAWPEVYFDGVGWVAFEPTPNRGAPGNEPYTGVPEQQASPTDPSAAVGPPDPTPGTVPSNSTPTSARSRLPNELATGATTSTTAKPAKLFDRLPGPARVAAPAAGGLSLLYLLLAPAIVVGARVRRRRNAKSERRKVSVAGMELAEDAALAGVERRPSETHAEYAHRLAIAMPHLASEIESLRRQLEQADYSPDALADNAGDDALAAADRINAEARRRAGTKARIQRALDLRPFIRARMRRRRRTAVAPTRVVT